MEDFLKTRCIPVNEVSKMATEEFVGTYTVILDVDTKSLKLFASCIMVNKSVKGEMIRSLSFDIEEIDADLEIDHNYEWEAYNADSWWHFYNLEDLEAVLKGERLWNLIKDLIT